MTWNAHAHADKVSILELREQVEKIRIRVVRGEPFVKGLLVSAQAEGIEPFINALWPGVERADVASGRLVVHVTPQ